MLSSGNPSRHLLPRLLSKLLQRHGAAALSLQPCSSISNSCATRSLQEQQHAARSTATQQQMVGSSRIVCPWLLQQCQGLCFWAPSAAAEHVRDSHSSSANRHGDISYESSSMHSEHDTNSMDTVSSISSGSTHGSANHGDSTNSSSVEGNTLASCDSSEAKEAAKVTLMLLFLNMLLSLNMLSQTGSEVVTCIGLSDLARLDQLWVLCKQRLTC
jgi:hypothetical protein